MSLTFNPITKKFSIDPIALEMAYHDLIYAIRSIRKISNLPMDKYKRVEGLLTDVDLSQKAILDTMKRIGLDVNACWGEELDVRTKEEIEDFNKEIK